LTLHATELLAQGMAFPEGPRWHDGRLYLVDHLLGHVYLLGDSGLETLVELSAGASGMGWTPAGDHLIVSMHDRRIVRFVDGELVETTALGEMVPGPLNEMVVGPRGDAFVGNFGSELSAGEPLTPTVLVRVEPDGSAWVAADDLVFPNGMVISEDGGTLIVAETFALRLSAFDIGEDGSLSNRRVWASFGEPPALPFDFEAGADVVREAGGVLPDGIALDAEGAVWVADPLGTDVLRVVEAGEVVDRVPIGDLGSYAVALGGEDRRTLYICANRRFDEIDPGVDRAGCLLSCRVEVPGAGWP
jgi:sugar lactone lactonase YvrE